MNDVRRPLRRDGPALPSPTRLLYLAGASAERDASTLQQLSALTGQVQLTTVGTAADVQQKIRGGSYHALVISHAWPQAETLSLISSLRKANAPIAIVPVVTETQRDLYASAVAVGADDVLILLGGTLLHPTETLVRVRQSRYLPAHEVEAVRAAIRGQHTTAPTEVSEPAAPPAPASPREAGPESRPVVAPFRSVDRTAPEPVPPVTGAARPSEQTPAVPTSFQTPFRAAAPPAPAPEDAGRRELERRLAEAQAEAADRREAQGALLSATQELERAAESHAAARAAWQQEREQLLGDARDASSRTSELEARLQAALADVERVSKLHGAAEASWEQTRREWEAGLARARHAQDTAVGQEREDRAAAEAALTAERAAWQEQRRELERTLDAATTLAASRGHLEAAVQTAEAALRQASEAHAAERRTWDATRHELEARAREAGTAAAARQAAAESALSEAREALRALEQTRTGEREDWARERAQFDARLKDLHAGTQDRRSLAAEIQTREADLTAATAALDAERAAAAALQERLAAQQSEIDVLVQARRQLEQTLDAARADLRQQGEARVEERTEAERQRRQLEEALDAARADLHALQQSRAGEQSEAARTRERVAQLEDELAEATRANRALDERLQAAGDDLRQASETLAATRAAADGLTRRLTEAESTARAERSDLERRLAMLGTELQQAIEAGTSDRVALEVASEQLRAQRAEIAAMTAARSEADTALARVRAEQEGVLAREAAARQEAEAARQAIEALRGELAAAIELRSRADRDRAEVTRDRDRLAAAHEDAIAEARRTTDGLRTEAARAAATVQQLQAALAELQADRQRLADEHARAHAGWQAEAREIGDALATERSAAAATCRELETVRAELEASTRQIGVLEQARDAVRQELDRLVGEHASATAAWDERRRSLEEDLAALHEARRSDLTEWMAARLMLETRLSQADDELDRQREETDTLRAELGRVAARYDRLARSELFGYGVTTLDGWLVHCNDAFARLLGYAHAREALASASEHAFGAEGSDVIGSAILVEGQTMYRDGMLTRVDGESIRVLQSALLVGEGQDALVERIVLDLSDRTALEERLRGAQRLEALGRITAAMAPELDALATALDSGSPVPLDLVDERGDGLAAVAELRQLLAFARKQARPAALIDLNDALERLSPMLARLVSSHVDFAMRLGPTALIAVDEEDFEQMATALVVTVRDRLTAGGTVLIESGAVETADSDRAPVAGVRAGGGALLTVSAVGYGVQPSEPLPALDALVARLGGTLELTGLAGRRLSLRVDLPRAR